MLSLWRTSLASSSITSGDFGGQAAGPASLRSLSDVKNNYHIDSFKHPPGQNKESLKAVGRVESLFPGPLAQLVRAPDS